MNNPPTPADPDREAALFALAVEKPPAERPAFLRAVCGNDNALRQRLEALIAAHETSTGILDDDRRDERRRDEFHESPSSSQGLTGLGPAMDEAVGQTLGRYKLLEKVGEGGCGVVYVAEQTEPVRRRVALKVIKLGMDTKQVVARFEAERQALAMMDHPNIAKVLDAGTTEGPFTRPSSFAKASAEKSGTLAPSGGEGLGEGGRPPPHHSTIPLSAGRPYFVMELVRGIRITDYCDQANLTTKERLDLFIKVCHAIQHAHQKGIIHRDIKPSNILVTLHDGVPVPKVIDFGIAKATEGRLTDATVYTQLHQFIGTPAYMSPEQAEMSGLDIDTRSDIYSLGVLLYELLAGSTPFDAKELMASGIDAMRKTIREKEPVRPSTRVATLGADQLTTTAKRRSVDTSKLMHQLRGDLDWIVMKCLEKDRARRYETANGLATDLKRHLDNEPVVARPPSAGYRLQKAFRRNKLVFSAGFAVGLTLLVGLGMAAMGWRQTRVERDKAIHARAGEEQQRKAAQASTVAAQEQRLLAQERELTVRSYLYAAQINRAQQSWKDGNIAQALALLASQTPKPGEADPRGFEWRYLHRLCQDESVATFGGHFDMVQSLALSPDGRTLAAADVLAPADAGTVKLWDIATRLPVAKFSSGNGPRFIEFAPDGLSLAIGGWDGPVEIWDVAAKQKTATLSGLDGKIENLAFSPDGRMLVAGAIGGEGKMAVWDVAAKTLLRSLPGVPTERPWIAFSPDAKTMASTSGDKTVRLWNVADWQEIASLAGHEGLVVCVAFSPDGKTLASASADSTVKIWEVASRRESVTLRGHKSWVTSVTFSPNGALLATTCVDGTVKLWNLATKQEVATLKGHTAWVNRAVFFPDSQMLASASDDKTVKIWRTTPQPNTDVLGRHSAPVTDGAFAHNGRFLATASVDRSVKLWDLVAGHEAATLPHLSGVNSVSFSPDDGLLATATDDGSVTLWDPHAQRQIAILKGHTGWVGCARFSLDGKFVVSGGDDKVIRLWDVATRREIMNLQGHREGVFVLRLSADGKLLASADWAGTMRLWDVTSRQELARFSGLTADPYRFLLQFSPDSRMLASSPHADNTVKLWGVSERGLLANLTGHTDQICAGVFSPDGRTIATCGKDNTVRLWELATGRQRAVLRGHAGWVTSVAFSPDGKTLATAGNDSTVRLWNPKSGQELATLPGGITGLGSRLMFSPDGNVLAGCGQEWLVRAWRAAPMEQVAAREGAERAATPAIDNGALEGSHPTPRR